MDLASKEQWAAWVLLGDPLEPLPKPLLEISNRIIQALAEYDIAMQRKRKDERII